MPQFVTTLINRFDGGISEDKRSGWVGSGGNFTTNRFSITKHFDTFTYPKKLVPYNSTEADEEKTYKIKRFLFSPGRIQDEFHGLGVDVGDTIAEIYIYNDLGAGTYTTWAVGESNATSSRVPDTTVFFYYKDFIYFFGGDRYVCAYNSTGATAIDDSFLDFGADYTSIVQPVHHPADDHAYFFINNVIHRLEGTSWNAGNPLLTLPSNSKITCACVYGNYLAIGCASKSAIDRKSTVYLWDRDSLLVSEIIDFGEGEIKHIANLNNRLVGIVDFYTTSAIGLTRGKIISKIASGNFGITVDELTKDTTDAGVATCNSVVRNNKLYFIATATLNSDTRFGIWAVDENGRMALDFIEEEATTYQGIYLTGNQWWIAHSGDGSINRSDETGAVYGHTSIYESLIFNAGDSSVSKKLIDIEVSFEKLPAITSQVVLEYRIDGSATWVEIFDYITKTTATAFVPGREYIITSVGTTDFTLIGASASSVGVIFTATGAGTGTGTANYTNLINHKAMNIESSGANFPEYKEIEFRIESKGGAAITGLKFKSEIMDK